MSRYKSITTDGHTLIRSLPTKLLSALGVPWCSASRSPNLILTINDNIIIVTNRCFVATILSSNPSAPNYNSFDFLILSLTTRLAQKFMQNVTSFCGVLLYINKSF